MLFNFFETAKIKAELSKKVLELQVRENELRIQNKTIEQELRLKLDHQNHTIDLERKTFQSEKANWEKDRQLEENRMKSTYQTQLDQAISLQELNKNQELAKQKNKFDTEMNALKTAHAEELSKTKTDLAQKYYNELHEMVTKFNTEGTVTTKFMSEVAMKLLGSMPASKSEFKMINATEKSEYIEK